MKAKGPWTQISCQEIYQNPWIQVEHHEVYRPDGKPGVYGVVHFKHLALGVVPVDDDGYTWLVGQYRYPLDLYSWEIPEGGGKSTETAQEAIARELKEETGLQAGRWIDLGQIHTSNSVCNESGRVFLAFDLQIGQAQPDGDEVLQVRRIPFLEACEMAFTGKITDAISVVTLLRAREWIFRHDPQRWQEIARNA